jgi:outer membrane protein assembly factor BamA
MRANILILTTALSLACGFSSAHAQTDSTTTDSIPAARVAPVDTMATRSIATADSVPQKDVFDVLFHDILHRPKKPPKPNESYTGFHWALLPTFSYNTVYGFAFGAMVAAAGQRGGPGSHYSSMRLGANYATNGQTQAYLRGDLFSKSEGWLFVPDLRWLDTDRKTWGLGPFDSDQQKYPMSWKLSRIYATIYRRTVGPLYVGAGYLYDQYNNIVDERANKGEDTPFTTYSGGAVKKTVATGWSANLLVDKRDNEVTPTHGYYLSTSYRDYMKSMGSDTDWTELWADVRAYAKLSPSDRNVLGLWLYGWGTTDKPPYLDLPSSGWDTYGRGSRGYVHGRIRGQDQLYAETEYRHTFTANGLFGGAIFANALSTTTTTTSQFESPDVGAGLGLRVRLNKHSRANLCIDYGRGINNTSHSWDLSMNESF